jgi:uncharacterized membrane protein YccF (DUF307 family)
MIHVCEILMILFGNILWFIFGGAMMALGWWIAGAFAYLSIIGIPWGKACFVIGQFALMPFGKQAVSRKTINNRNDIGTGNLGAIGNIIWFIFAGIWLAICHMLYGLICFITIIGIPFGLQHLKLAALAIAPIGKTIIDN